VTDRFAAKTHELLAGPLGKSVRSADYSSRPEGQRFQNALLQGDERVHSLARVGNHLRQLLVVEDLVFSRGLDFY
jgi:hypothetical protein